MGNSISRGTLDIFLFLFPFVLSAGLIISIVICWWKCKIFYRRRRPGKPRKSYQDEADFGHLINIQEYAENQIGTTIVYADAPGSGCPHPYVYFSDGKITRIMPLIPNHFGRCSHSDFPSSLSCNNFMRNGNQVGSITTVSNEVSCNENTNFDRSEDTATGLERGLGGNNDHDFEQTATTTISLTPDDKDGNGEKMVLSEIPQIHTDYFPSEDDTTRKAQYGSDFCDTTEIKGG